MRELSLINCRLSGRYDVRELLGRGSYAEVFLGRDTFAPPEAPHAEVVIKALNVFLQDDLDRDLERTLVENFQNEAVALDRVRHPNIISRLGHGTARDLKGTVFHFMVLEYLSGGDLHALVRRQALKLATALSYIEQTCAGLAHAHERGIIHRDIKPQNLLLTADLSTVKIADFGVARLDLGDAPITRVGTDIYAPPEHSPYFTGHTGVIRLTPAADVYSLAKTAYTLVTGVAPRAFANESVGELPAACRDEDWAVEFARVVRRATASAAAERHQSVGEFWADLVGVRDIAADGDMATVIRPKTATPQPHVARGYSPITPEAPEFENAARPTTALYMPAAAVPQKPAAKGIDAKDGRISVPIDGKTPRKRSFVRRFVMYLVALLVFTGLLYATAAYMRGRGVLPEIKNPFRVQTATANTDIYLRPTPNTDNTPVGLVTKNSKVRIVNSQNNWYQVDVIEQGRVRPTPTLATRGWLNGKYLDLDD
ncbi:MAG: protein kinase [Pyrinomonadaceae bacterium]|nr:protein kinase [Pyrinomonadaceae bacterium]